VTLAQWTCSWWFDRYSAQSGPSTSVPGQYLVGRSCGTNSPHRHVYDSHPNASARAMPRSVIATPGGNRGDRHKGQR